MKLLGVLSMILFMISGPFSLGIYYAASQLTYQDRKPLEMPAKALSYVAFASLMLFSLVLVYYTTHTEPSN